MSERSLHEHVLPAIQAGMLEYAGAALLQDEAALLAGGGATGRAEAVLLRLLRLGASDAASRTTAAPGMDALLRWLQDASNPAHDDRVLRALEESTVLAEMAEAWLEEGAGAGSVALAGPLRLAAAGADVAAEARPVWPARYAAAAAGEDAAGLELWLGIEESGLLYAELRDERGPAPASPAVAIRLAGLDPLPLRERATGRRVAVIGPADEVLGGPAEWNPWRHAELLLPDGRALNLLRVGG
jgi:hypothetical protein